MTPGRCTVWLSTADACASSGWYCTGCCSMAVARVLFGQRLHPVTTPHNVTDVTRDLVTLSPEQTRNVPRDAETMNKLVGCGKHYSAHAVRPHMVAVKDAALGGRVGVAESFQAFFR